MKTSGNALLIVSVGVMLAIWSFVAAQAGGYIPASLELVIFLLIMLFGVYGFFVHLRRHKDLMAGLPPDDELSEQIKYHAGYNAFITSLYIWFCLFLLKDMVPDHDTLFGLGVLLPAVIFMVGRSYLGRNFNENPD